MNQKRKMRCTSQKGITLIALVITIIVLLILAGVTISMVLGDDGIIAQAQEAKEANVDGQEKDNISVAKGEAALATYDKQTPVKFENLGAIKTKIDTYNTGKTGDDVYEYKDTVSKIVDGVPIPMGFAYVEGTKVDTGLIVVDGYGNEYVWVPVDGQNVKLQLNSEYGARGVNKEGATDVTNNQNIVGDMNQELADMQKSVSLYGGFYVGRYETSWTGSRVASVPNKMALNTTMTIGEKNVNWALLYQEQKKLHENSESVVSGMIYGSQWDAIMDWMSSVVNKNAFNPEETNKYIFDSSYMGNYSNLCSDCGSWGCEKCNNEGFFESFSTIETGSNSDFAVKNIYDLAGNYSELTQETDAIYMSMRGGYYWHTGVDSEDGHPVSCRCLATSEYDVTSRLQIYIK